MGWVYFGITSGLVETKHKKESGEEKTGRQRGNEGECGVYCGFLFFLFRFLFSLFSCLIDFDYCRVWERFDVAGEVFVLSRTWMGYCLRRFYRIKSIVFYFSIALRVLFCKTSLGQKDGLAYVFLSMLKGKHVFIVCCIIFRLGIVFSRHGFTLFVIFHILWRHLYLIVIGETIHEGK